MEAAIGLFHVHAHKDECFFHYASSFIPGAGVVAGEILELLWSSLNSISPTARTATLAHRAEMLDDHATDSNHKKMLGIVSTLCKGHQMATDMVESAQLYYENLSNQAGPMAVAKWKADIEVAETQHLYDLAVMDIYCSNLDDHNSTDNSLARTIHASVRGYRISSGPPTPLYVLPHRCRLQISKPSPDLPTTQ